MPLRFAFTFKVALAHLPVSTEACIWDGRFFYMIITVSSVSFLFFLFLGVFYIDNGLHWWLSGKESACQCKSSDLITGLGRSLAEVNGKPLQYSFLGNAMEEEPSGLHTVHEVTKESDTN